MDELSVFKTLFEDEEISASSLPGGGEALTVQNSMKEAPLSVYYRPESAYPYTISFEGVSLYFVTEEEAFSYACELYGGSMAVLNFFSQGVSRLRYAIPLEKLDLETTISGFALSASGGREALSGIIAALVAKGNCVCRMRTWGGEEDQSILISL